MPPQRIRLSPFALEDYTTLASWIANEREQVIWSANTFPYPITRDDMADYLSLCHADTPHREFMKAVDENSGAMVGVFSLKRIDSLGRTGHLSMIMVSPEMRGMGSGAAMVTAALDRGFQTKGFRRMQLYVFDFNTAAKKCYTRCGLAQEKAKVEALAYGDELWKIEVMSKAREQAVEKRRPAR